MLHLPRIDRKDIEHEAQVIKRICGEGAHPHIVEVLKLGELRNVDYYFIDMELCDLNLSEYIHRSIPLNPSESIPYFIKNLPPPLKAQQIWNIMKQIANGVNYMHTARVVHRDLKPANSMCFSITHDLTVLVLYSRKDSVWKLADFGFTTDATSNTLHTSNDARGTPCYRAPELLAFDKPTYNNKVDIWSLGCILYELSVGQRVFNNDWATLEYKASSESGLEIPLDEYFSDQCKETIRTNIRLMLQIDYTSRPSAVDLLEEFSRNFQLTQACPHPNIQICLDFHENQRAQQPSGNSTRLAPSSQHNGATSFRDVSILSMTDLSCDDGGVGPSIGDSHTKTTSLASSSSEFEEYELEGRQEARFEDRQNNSGFTWNESSDLRPLEVVQLFQPIGGTTGPLAFEAPLATTSKSEDTERRSVYERVKLLKERGIILSEVDRASRLTPMHRAAKDGDVIQIKALKELGGDVSIPGDLGTTPMIEAAWDGRVDAIKALNELGADVEGRDWSGMAPMHYAASRGEVDVIEVLKELGGDVSIRDHEGRTPMHWAASRGQVNSIKLLNKLGGDISARSNNGSTPLRNATRTGEKDAAKALKELGAKQNHCQTQ